MDGPLAWFEEVCGKTGEMPMSVGWIRGYLIYTFDGVDWFYLDGTTAKVDRPCARCGKESLDGTDPCLGMLPGVTHACCGHGVPEQDYVVFGGRRMSLAEYCRKTDMPYPPGLGVFE